MAMQECAHGVTHGGCSECKQDDEFAKLCEEISAERGRAEKAEAACAELQDKARHHLYKAKRWDGHHHCQYRVGLEACVVHTRITAASIVHSPSDGERR